MNLSEGGSKGMDWNVLALDTVYWRTSVNMVAVIRFA
jgi:hypothetical protein